MCSLFLKESSQRVFVNLHIGRWTSDDKEIRNWEIALQLELVNKKVNFVMRWVDRLELVIETLNVFPTNEIYRSNIIYDEMIYHRGISEFIYDLKKL
jgi:hypothetical protein